MIFQNELTVALRAVEKAVRLCRKVQQNGVTAMQKKDHSPVTLADLASQAVITMELLAGFTDPVVAEEEAGMLRDNPRLSDRVLKLVQEETGPVDTHTILDAIDYGAKDADFNGRFWTVDPIDGTKGFLRGDQYAIALALVDKGQVVMGVLGCPNFSSETAKHNDMGSIFYAVRGGGAFVYKIEDGKVETASVDHVTEINKARFCESVETAHSLHEVHQKIADALGITAAPCRKDSQVKYAVLACGKASIYLRLPRKNDYREKIWDHAAGSIIVEEAGGKVSDFNGNPLQFNLGRKLENNIGILATNGDLHQQVIEAGVMKIISKLV
jgi:3'(2'), 5'-bisphosphate nucleotidase